MAKKYELAVFIGRFQPFHNGHVRVIEHGLEIANRVRVLVGSAFGPRCYRNPFTYEERKEFIKNSFPTPDVQVMPLPDSALEAMYLRTCATASTMAPPPVPPAMPQQMWTVICSCREAVDNARLRF